MTKIWRHTPWILLITIVFAVLYTNNNIHEGDPDRYYHLALAKETMKAGKFYLRQIPQIVGLGWNEYFPDKEFLFHVVTSLGYRLGGDRGAVITSLGISLAALLFIYFIATQFLSPVRAFLATAIAFASPILVIRLFLLRPHTLAILTFLFLQWGLIGKRVRFLFFGAALYALSYHAFYLVLICLVISLSANLLVDFSHWRKHLQFHGWGLAGLATGILINPYFPANVILGWNIASITPIINEGKSLFRFGMELYPLRSDELVVRIFYPALIFLISSVFWLRSSVTKRSVSTAAHLYTVLILGFFLLLTTQSPRSAEYAVPLASLALIFILKENLWDALLGKVTAAILIVSALVSSFTLVKVMRGEIQISTARVNNNLAAANSIPHVSGPKVYNCEWDRTPYLFYARPEATFVDILDPTLLMFQNRPLANLRELLNQGFVADPRRFISEAFHSEYVYCYWPPVVAQLQRDPSFRQIFPKTTADLLTDDLTMHVFQVVPEIREEFARTFNWSEWTDLNEKNYLKLTPATASIGRRGKSQLEKTTYLNLAEHNNGALRCTSITPELKQSHLGAEYLGLGGGDEFRVWRNGKPLFASLTPTNRVASVQILVPIPPAKKNDRFEIVACSGGNTRILGASVSFWQKDRLKTLCKEKANDHNPQIMPSQNQWDYSFNRQETCIAPIAPKMAKL